MLWGLQGFHGYFGGATSAEGELGAQELLPSDSSAVLSPMMGLSHMAAFEKAARWLIKLESQRSGPSLPFDKRGCLA